MEGLTNNFMKKIIICTFLLLLISKINRAQNNTLTLKQCITLATENNLQVNQAKLQAERDAATLKQNNAGKLPTVNGNINYGFNQGRSIDPFSNSFINQQLSFSQIGLNANVPIWNYNQLKNIVQQGMLTYQASMADQQQAKDNLTLNIISAYLQILVAEDILALLQANLTVSKKQVERLEQLGQEGATAPFNITDMKGQQANDELTLINAENNLQQARIALFQLMNLPNDASKVFSREDVNLSTGKYPDTEDVIYKYAVENLAIVKSANYRKAAGEKAIKVAKADFYPTLSAFGGVGSNYSSVAQRFSFVNESFVPSDSYVDVGGTKLPVFNKQTNFKKESFGLIKQFDNNLNTNYGLSLQIPIANNLRAKTRVTQAKINYQNAILVEQNALMQLNQSINQSYQNMLASYNRMKVFDKQVNAFEESFRAATIRFESGVINSVEYLQVRNNLDRSKINQLQNKYEYALRVRLLDFYMGRLR